MLSTNKFRKKTRNKSTTTAISIRKLANRKNYMNHEHWSSFRSSELNGSKTHASFLILSHTNFTTHHLTPSLEFIVTNVSTYLVFLKNFCKASRRASISPNFFGGLSPPLRFSTTDCPHVLCVDT
eukprot:Trichotokara_eunicae@DN4409_c0_g1_i1.p1